MDAAAAEQRHHEEEDDEEDDDDDEDGDDDYDFDGGGDAVDDVPSGPAVAGLSRVKRSCWPCWPPPPQKPPPPRAPVWSPLLRVQPVQPEAPAHKVPAGPEVPPPSRHASQPGPWAGPSGPSRSQPQRAAAKPKPHGPPPAPRMVSRPAGLNPVYGNRMKLYCRTGFHLTIGPKGRVTGTANPNDKYAVLEFSSVTNGEVRIRGVEANLFLAMNRQGKLYGQANVRQEGTVFVEMMLGQYNTYLSRKFAHVGWYVGIKKNGKQKPGQKTAWGQKAIQFLPIRV